MAVRALITVAIVAGAVTLAAQQQTFRADVRVVPIYATVTGPDGRLLSGLGPDDFTVFDDGKLRPVTVFSSEPVAVTATVLWDVSNSQTIHAPRSRAVARALVDAFWPDDRVRFGTFGAAIVFSPHLTADKQILRRIVAEEIWFGGGTPLWTAVRRSLVDLSRADGRRVLVVMTDGEASADSTSRRDVLAMMHRADVMVYVLGLEDAAFAQEVREVAEEGGGGYLRLMRDGDVEREMAAVVSEIHHQYLIGFSPGVPDGRLHRLTVGVRTPGAKVRARRSYVAPAKLPES
jgi:VWFA-related protein